MTGRTPPTPTTKSPRTKVATGHPAPAPLAEPRAEGPSRRPSGTRRAATDRDAFISTMRTDDTLAEELAEDFVRSALSGENEQAAAFDQEVAEEMGGPFVESTAEDEIAHDEDEANPPGATREPFPTT